MSRYQAYARTPLERSGQVNYRPEDKTSSPIAKRSGRFRLRDPNCVIVVTKKKQPDAITKESDPINVVRANTMLQVFDKQHYLRYRVNVYLK